MKALNISVAFSTPSEKVLGKRGAAMLAQLKSLASSLDYQITTQNESLILITLQAGSNECIPLRITNLKSNRFYSCQVSFIRQKIDVLGNTKNINSVLARKHSLPEKILTLVEMLAQN